MDENYNSEEELIDIQREKEEIFDKNWENVKITKEKIDEYEKKYIQKRFIQNVNIPQLFDLLVYNKLPKVLINKEKSKL